MTEENKVEQIIDKVSNEVAEKCMKIIDQSEITRFIERIERLEEEKKGLLADIREIYAEAKGAGFDTKVMRQIIKLRKMNPADKSEFMFNLEEYDKLLK